MRPSRSEHRLRRAVGDLAAAALLATTVIVAGESPALSDSPTTISGSVTAKPDKYKAETVIYLKSVPGTHAPKTVNMDQKGMAFIPHVLAVTVGDTVAFLNHDSMPHNVFSTEGGYNLGSFGPEETRTHTFDKAGAFTQLCSLHPEMLGYIFVGQNPYEAVVDSAGHYAIKDVPPGTYDVVVWNSHLKAPAQNVTVGGGKTQQVDFELHR
jgi:plastocyanin